MSSSIVGAILAIFVMYSVVNDGGEGHYWAYYNLVGIIIVLGGTASAAIISCKVEGVVILIRTLIKVLKSDKAENLTVVRQLIRIAQLKIGKGQYVVKCQGSHPFILDGLRLIDNDFDSQSIEAIMTTGS